MTKKQKLVAQIPFTEEIAKSFHNPRYYSAESERLDNLTERENEKQSLSTKNKKVVTNILEEYKQKGFGNIKADNNNNIFNVLERIYKVNQRVAIPGLPPPKHDNLLSIVSHPKMLMQAYRSIKGNSGVLTQAIAFPTHELSRLSPESREFLEKATKLPDGININTFITVSELLRKKKFKWGYSRRIWIPKPQGGERPITIPPFMDRVVQESIRTVLECVYYSIFDGIEIQNVSFGFRSNKGTHDAITLLIDTNEGTQGLTIAIEGDIKGAYDNIDKDILVSILARRIADKRFLTLIRDCLDLKMFDTKDNQ